MPHKDPEARRECKRRWAEKNPEKVRANSRAQSRRRHGDPRLRPKTLSYMRDSNLKRLYGITLEQFEQMLSDQGGKCKACGTDTPGGRGAFHVDHCHQTGKIRGLLCHGCNVALGNAGDSLTRLTALVRYLQENG